MLTSPARLRSLRPAALALCVLGGLGLASPPSAAALSVDVLATLQGDGSYLYDVSIVNDGATDVILVSIVDAPVGDATIAATLTAPAGHIASYDGGFGIVDFLEDTSVFAAGTTTPGFSFRSQSAPGPGIFATFEAYDVNLQFLSGGVDVTLVPEPDTLILLAAALAAAARIGRTPRRSTR